MKPKKAIVIIFLVALGVGAFFFAPLLFKPAPGPAQACFGTHCFDVEVARTTADQQKGLMFREKLDRNKGMLFIFGAPGSYPFWMKNTLIPLDIIWINQNREVVYIEENAQPCKQVECPLINPSVEAKYVLEVNGGVANEIKLNTGSKIYFVNLDF